MFEGCLYFNSNTLTRKLNARWNAAFARFDLPPSHAYLLRLVMSSPGLSQQAISDELQLEKSTITRFLSTLEAKNLIVRRASEIDPRQNCVHPSKAALSLQSDLEDVSDELYTLMGQKMGAQKVQDFVATLRDISSHL